jgi:hypothetical protein
MTIAYKEEAHEKNDYRYDHKEGLLVQLCCETGLY